MNRVRLVDENEEEIRSGELLEKGKIYLHHRTFYQAIVDRDGKNVYLLANMHTGNRWNAGLTFVPFEFTKVREGTQLVITVGVS